MQLSETSMGELALSERFFKGILATTTIFILPVEADTGPFDFPVESSLDFDGFVVSMPLIEGETTT